MSEPINWKALGEKTQKESTEKLRREQELSAQQRNEALAAKAENEMLMKRAVLVLEELRKECTSVIRQYNSGLTDRGLMLEVVGLKPEVFRVTKVSTPITVIFEIEAGKVNVTRKQSSRAMIGTADHYGVDDEQRLTMRNGAGIIPLKEVVDQSLQWLIHSESLG